MRLFKRKIKYDTVEKFNRELDKNQKIKEALNRLSLQKTTLGRNEYLEELLILFRKEGVDITLRELDLLLLLRSKVNQIALEDELAKTSGK